MKRDMDLIRLILLEIEKQNDPFFTGNIEVEDYSEGTINFHIMLMAEAGLIQAIDLSSNNDINWLPQRITWDGYEFLDAARDNNRWNKAKEILAESGGFVLEVAKQVLIDIMKGQINKTLG